MEAVVEQCYVDRKCCEIQQKQILIENDRLLDKIISHEIVNIVLNSSVVMCDSMKKIDERVDISNNYLELEAEFVKKNDPILNFQNEKSCVNQNAPEIHEYFEQNDLQGQLHAKGTVISKLKETIHSLRDNANPGKVKRDIDEIETINIELEHSVAKLLSENEFLHKEIKHLKKIYKDQFDSIKKTRVCSKEQCDSLIANLNSKSMENADLKAQIQEKEVLVYVKDTCPCLTKPSEKLVIVTPLNKDKKVRFVDPVTSSSNTQIQVNSHKTKDSNQPLLHSTGVICSAGASGSKPTGNTKNNRISQSSSSNKTNKVEDQSRSVKSRTNKKNRVSKTECNADVIHSMLNANSESVCAICNESLFDSNHDKCVLDYVHDVNVKADVGNCIQWICLPANKACRYTTVGGLYHTIMEIIHVDFDELTAMAYEQSSSGPALQEMTHRTLSLRLVPNPSSPTPFVIPTRNDRDTLFQPLFDEYFNLPPSVDYPVPEVAVPEPAVSTVLPLGVEEEDHDIKVAHMDNDPYFGISIPKPSSEESSSQVVIPNNVHSVN
ncbi:hypothetical protein Tco_0578391 [Tanacetum coccineum]